MDEAERLIASIIETQKRMQHIIASDRSHPLFASPLTIPQLRIIMELSLRGGASGQDLARFMGVSLATISGIVDRLVAQGLVTRREDPRDRRVRRIELSPAGEEMTTAIITAGTERQRQFLGRLTAEELAVVERGLCLLVDAAAAELAETAAAGRPEADTEGRGGAGPAAADERRGTPGG